jgi:hypothetical protein
MRNIPYELPRTIYRLAEERYFDTSTMHYIAIKHAKYGKKSISFMIAYDKKRETVEIVTIHPVNEAQIKARVEGKRWIKSG